MCDESHEGSFIARRKTVVQSVAAQNHRKKEWFTNLLKGVYLRKSNLLSSRTQERGFLSISILSWIARWRKRR